MRHCLRHVTLKLVGIVWFGSEKVNTSVKGHSAVEVFMEKRRKYSPEFKREAVELPSQPGQTVAGVARDLAGLTTNNPGYFADLMNPFTETG